MGHYLQATVDFPGIIAPIGGSYTLSHGQQPGRILITCTPQPINLLAGAIGTVTFRWRDQLIRLKDCRVYNHAMSGNGDSGYELNIFLWDRRWKWNNRTIFGRYNVRTSDNTVYTPTKKNPRQLAKLCLDAMKETKVNLEGLPENDYPFVDWYGSRAADELCNICDRYGCRLVMQWDGSIAIRKVGVGQPLPLNLPYSQTSESLQVPVLPDSIEVHFGPTKFQVDSLLEEMALDTDGDYVTANEASYAPKVKWDGSAVDPKDKWAGESPGTCSLLIKNIGDAGATPRTGDRLWTLELARRSLFRAFQIALRNPIPGNANGSSPIKVPGYKGKLELLSQILPIDDTIYNVVREAADPQKERPIDDNKEQFYNTQDVTMIWGDFWKQDFIAGRDTDPYYTAFAKEPSKNSYRPGRYSIDRERGIVMFDEPVWRRAAEQAVVVAGFPTLNLRPLRFPILAMSFMTSIRDQKTGEPEHYVVKRTVTSKPTGTGPLVLVHPEYQLYVTHDWLPDGSPSEPRTPNKKLLDKIGNLYIDYALRHFQVKNPNSLTYSGLWPINPDGAIMEVSISVGGNGGDTVASYNDERSFWEPTYEQKRANERTRQGIAGLSLSPKVFYAPPQSFPYNMGSVYQSISPSRRG